MEGLDGAVLPVPAWSEEEEEGGVRAGASMSARVGR